MEHIIRIKKASFYGYHGVYKEEQNVGGKFEADIELFTDFSDAAANDKLQNTIDYEKVYSILHDIAVTQKFYLLERIAQKISAELFIRFPMIHKAVVRVRKNNPPIGGVVDCVEIEVVQSREEYEAMQSKPAPDIIASVPPDFTE